MRQITNEIQITIDGSPVGFRLTKLDAFSGVALLRLLLRLESGGGAPAMLAVSFLCSFCVLLWGQGLTG